MKTYQQRLLEIQLERCMLEVDIAVNDSIQDYDKAECDVITEAYMDKIRTSIETGLKIALNEITS